MSLRNASHPARSIFSHCAGFSSTVRGFNFSPSGLGGLPPGFFGLSMIQSLARTKTACKAGWFRSYLNHQQQERAVILESSDFKALFDIYADDVWQTYVWAASADEALRMAGANDGDNMVWRAESSEPGPAFDFDPKPKD